MLGLVAQGAVCLGAEPDHIAIGNAGFSSDVAPFVEGYCVDCHNESEANGGFNVEAYADVDALQRDYDVWEKVAQVLEFGQMPPEDAEQPEDEERLAIGRWVRDELDRFECSDPPYVGRVTLRRLNRAEYDNTIRDLTGLDLNLSENFPSDDVGYGFDNIGDVLSTSPLLLEKYLFAAEQVALRAIETTPPQQAVLLQRDARRLESTLEGSANREVRAHVLGAAAEVFSDAEFEQAGEYVIAWKAYEFPAGDESARMVVSLNGEEVAEFAVAAKRGEPEIYHTEPLTIAAGEHRITAAFVNELLPPPVEEEEAEEGEGDDADSESDADSEEKRERRRGPLRDTDLEEGQRGLAIERLEIRGPLAEEYALRSNSHRRIIFLPPNRNDPEEAFRRIFERFAMRAFRRPVSETELAQLTALAMQANAEGASLEESVQLGVQAVLSSPSFLFRYEPDPEPAVHGAARLLSDYELATRLSYFLWSSMPDEELFAAAADGRLRAELDAQVRRMIADPKSRALVENFGGQWLTLRNLANFDPNPKQFPEFDEELRAAMLQETYALFDHIMREDRSVFEFLTADYTFVNERLAKHYGVDGVVGDRFRQVSLVSSPRGGVLTHASVLALTSNPTRTSPVKRGKWVLEQMLGTPPPPPPPNAGELPEGGEALRGSLREQMEQHRANSMCAACHAKMDPIGFGLENFDATGAWRDRDGEYEIDASGELPGGLQFQGPGELRTVLAANQDKFRKALAKQMLTYAIGRGVGKQDRCTLRTITSRLAEADDRFSGLVLAIVHSEPFQMRGGLQDAE